MIHLNDGYFHNIDADIYYRMYENSLDPNRQRVLLLLHGNGEDWTCFQKQIDAFSEDHTLITMDSRGHGLSQSGSTPVTLKTIARDALALLRFLNISHASLIGFSDGANAAMEIALHSSFKIDCLILAGGNLFPQGVKAFCQIPVTIGYYMTKMLSYIFPSVKTKSQILGLMVKEPHINPAALGKIKVRTLILAGERDVIKNDHTRLIASSIPNCKQMIIPGASHFVFGKWSDATNRCILEFLDS